LYVAFVKKIYYEKRIYGFVSAFQQLKLEYNLFVLMKAGSSVIEIIWTCESKSSVIDIL